MIGNATTAEYERTLGRVLWWAAVEIGLASLSDRFGRSYILDDSPRLLSQKLAFAGPVVLLSLQPAPSERSTPSDTADPANPVPGHVVQVLRNHVRRGVAVLFDMPDESVTAFGSNVALEATLGGAGALITNGSVRDSPRLARLPVLVASNRVSPLARGDRNVRLGLTHSLLNFFGSTWHGDDYVLIDGDGLMRLPAHVAADVANDLIRTEPDLRRVYGLRTFAHRPTANAITLDRADVGDT